MASNLEKPMPNDPEAERLVLGCTFLDNSVLKQARESLTAEDFFNPSHRRVYQVMVALDESKRDINPIAVCDELRKTGDLESVGGAAWLVSLFDGAPRFSSVESYTQIVREKATLRRMIHAANRVMAAAFDGEDSAAALLTRARQDFDAIEDPEQKGNWITAQQAAEDYLNHVQARIESGRIYDGIVTGFHDLDEELGGLPLGTLTLIAARPGMGKTALLTQIVTQAGRSRHNPDLVVAVFQMEMQNVQTMQRMHALESGVSVRDLRNLSAWKDRESVRALKEASEKLAGMPLLFNYDTGITPVRFASEIKRLKRQYKGREIVAIVDYAQRMRASDKRITSAYDKGSALSLELCDCTKDLNVATIAAAQLRRGSEKRADNRPTMEEIRDSGQWEQDAAVIMTPYRPTYYNLEKAAQREMETDAEFLVLKGRFSGNSKIPMYFDPTRLRYLEPAKDERAGFTQRMQPQRISTQSAAAFLEEAGW